MKQKFYRNGVFYAGILAGLFGMPAAGHAESARFEQVSNWAISKVDPKDHTPPYCTMAARYDNNAVLTLARNDRAETTLAFDFQRPVFMKDQTYFTTVRIGNLSRNLNLKPASSSALIIRTGADDQIDAALTESAFVALGINGGEYRFDVTDYATAQKQMALCLGADMATTMVADAVPSVAPVTQPPVQVKEIAEVQVVPPIAVTSTDKPIQVKISPNAGAGELEAQLRAALAERDAYRDLLEKTNSKKSEQARESRPQDQAELGKALQELDALQAERADLIRKLERAKADAAVTVKPIIPETTTAVSPELLAAQKALADIQTKNADLKKQLEQTQKDIIASRATKPETTPKIVVDNGKPDAQLLKLQADIARLETENESLRDQSTKVVQDKAAMDLAAKRFAEAEAENQRLAKELADKTNQPIKPLDAPEKVKEIVKADPKIQARFDVAEQENQRLAQQLAAARAELQRASTADAAARDADMAKQIADAKAEQDAKAANQMQLQSRFAEAERENKRLAQDLERMRQAQNIKQAAGGPKSPTADIVGVISTPVVAEKPAPIINPTPVKPAVVDKTIIKTPIVAVASPSGKVVQSVLTKAGVKMVQGFENVPAATTADKSAFRWDTGQAFGNALVERMQGSFVGKMREYLNKTKSRCTGTFDESTSAVQSVQGRAYALADVACVLSDKTGTGAALVFFEQDGLFNVVAHEADLNGLGAAMDARDKVSAALR